MKPIRKPDLNAPRYRAKRTNILNAKFYNAFREAHPKYSYLTDKDIKKIIQEVNGKIWQTAIDKRDGVELPERLGYIFIGSCPAKKSLNKNYFLSTQLEQVIQHRNWESDSYLAKIFYTNYGFKYNFQYSKLWGFSATRNFSRNVGKTYPEEFKKYLVVDDKKKIHYVFEKHTNRMKHKKIEEETLKSYDEFDFD